MAGGNREPGSSVLSKASQILALFETERRPLTLTEIVEGTGLATSSTHRILQELVDLELFGRTADHRYQPGLRLWRLGESVGNELRFTALPFLQDLYTRTEQTTHLAIRDGAQALYLMRLFGTARIPKSSSTGGRLPLHTTAVGKVITAFETSVIQDALYRHITHELSITHPGQTFDLSAYRTEIAKIRTQGFAETLDTQRIGTASIAVPILHSGTVGGALGIVVSTDKRGLLRTFLPDLQRTSRQIENATINTPIDTLLTHQQGNI